MKPYIEKVQEDNPDTYAELVKLEEKVRLQSSERNP
jgi:hypothetical protein